MFSIADFDVSKLKFVGCDEDVMQTEHVIPATDQKYIHFMFPAGLSTDQKYNCMKVPYSPKPKYDAIDHEWQTRMITDFEKESDFQIFS